MSPPAADPRALAAQRRGRIHALRMRIVTGAVAGFLAIWGVLFAATGHDPGLNDASTAAVVQSADPDVLETDTSTDPAGQPSTAAADSGAVTTRQS